MTSLRRSQRGRRCALRSEPMTGSPNPASELTAQQKYSCPACGAEANWNPARQALVCPFCGTVSPAKLDEDTGKIVEHDLVAALRGIADDQRGWQTEKRYVKCQSCQAISVLDPARQAQTLRILRLGPARTLRTEQSIDPSGEPAAVQAERRPGARPHPRLVRQALARAERLEAPGAYRYRQGHLPSLLDLRRARRCDLDRGSRPLLLHHRNLHRRRAGARSRARCSTCAGSPPPGSLRISSTTTWCARRSACIRRCCAASSRFPPPSSSPTTPGYVAGWVGRALPDRSHRRGEGLARGDGRETAPMCAAQVRGDTYRNLEVRANYSGQTLQAHPGAGLAAQLQLRRRGRSRRC